MTCCDNLLWVIGDSLNICNQTIPVIADGVFVYADPLGWTTSSDMLDVSTSEGSLFDSSVKGNLTGNIRNGGFAVEGDEVVYVALKDGIFALEDDTIHS